MPAAARLTKRKIRHAHIFCGVGGGAKGFNEAEARLGNVQAEFECLGGIDNDPGTLKDFETLTGIKGTCLDLFSLEQYRAFHGAEPPPGWREATPDDFRRAFGYKHPHIGFLSAPCKGFSGLLPETTSKTAKYQALNALTLRGLWLFLEAHKDDPVEIIAFENVPRIQTRGRFLLDQIIALLAAYGYVVRESTHDCGELGELSQSRKRFLLVARHAAKVPAFVYEPEKHRLRGIGEVLERMPLPGPGNTLGGPMHRMPSLQWQTWVRLAFVEAGSDWRSLNRLKVENGVLADFGIEPDAAWFNGAFGVKGWGEPSGTVTSKFQPSSGATSVADPRPFEEGTNEFKALRVRGWDQNAQTVTCQKSPGSSAQSVADPRIAGDERSVQFGVREWEKPAGVVTAAMYVGGGPNSVADPRITDRTPFNHAYRIVRWGQTGQAVTAARGALAAVADPRGAEDAKTLHGKYRVTKFDAPTSAVIGGDDNGAYGVADPRVADRDHSGTLGVKTWDQPIGVVAGQTAPSNGAYSVADPRHRLAREKRKAYDNGGHYGVLPWDQPSGTVSSVGQHDNGMWSVADPRPGAGDPSATFVMPAAKQRLVCVIHSLDGTWHRPLTTLELAALQSLVEPEEFLVLDGLSDSAWRERIGNAVPPKAAKAMAGVFGRTLLGVWYGETFRLSSEAIWVRNVAVALSIDGDGLAVDGA